MNWYEKFVVPIWQEYKLCGFVVIVAMLVALAWFFQLPIRDWVERLLKGFGL